MAEAVELEKLRRNVYSCVRCGICRSKFDEKVRRVCPVRETTPGFEPYFSRGRNVIARGILEGRVGYSDELAETLYMCLLCGDCAQQCGSIDMEGGLPKVNSPEICKAMRADTVRAGYKLPDGAVTLMEAVERTHNIFAELPEERTRWVQPGLKIAKESDTLLFPGCVSSYRRTEMAALTARILNNAGVEFTTLGAEEWCCGHVLVLLGELFGAAEIARRNVNKFKEMGIKRIISACPSCTLAFKEEYLKLLGEEYVFFEVFNTVEVINELISEGKIKLRKKIKEKVTYHDPCDLGRHQGIYDLPRAVIQSVPGIELIEILPNRENAWCCGGGGGVKASYPQLSIDVGLRRLDQIVATGAKTVVSACPTCKWNISDAIEAAKSDLKMIDITELVAESMGIEGG